MKKTHNQLVVQEMLRTSNIITHLRNARAELEKAYTACNICIESGKINDSYRQQLSAAILNNRIIESNFTVRMGKLSKSLNGFDPGTMDSIEYISRFDVKNKVVDIVRNTKYVAWLHLDTGIIDAIKEEESPTA